MVPDAFGFPELDVTPSVRWENVQASDVPADTFSSGNTGVLHNDTLFAFGTVTFMFDGTEGSDHTVATAVVKGTAQTIWPPATMNLSLYWEACVMKTL
ncbi:hypothetical protein WJX82_005729 [Trebouxia sp. C0006]